MSAATTSGNQPPSSTFIMLARDERQVDGDEQAGDGEGERQAPAPDFPHRQEHQHRGQQHGQRHGDAERGGEIVGRAEASVRPSVSTISVQLTKPI